MFDLNLKGTKKSKTSRKGKEVAGVSSQVETDRANPTVLLPIHTDGTNVGTGLSIAQLNPTEVRMDGAGRQLELELEPVDGAGRQQERGLEDQGESSHAGRHDDQVDGTAGQVNQAAKPSMKEVLEAMQAMRTQILALTQAFTPVRTAIPIGNDRTCQVVAAQAAGRAAQNQVEEVAEVIEIDPPARTTKRMDYLKPLEHISKLGTKHFSGSVDPLEADEWRSRLVRNFSSTRTQMTTRRTLRFTSWKVMLTTGGWL